MEDDSAELHILTELSEVRDAVNAIERGKTLASGTVDDPAARPAAAVALAVLPASERLERPWVEQPAVMNARAGPRPEFEALSSE